MCLFYVFKFSNDIIQSINHAEVVKWYTRSLEVAVPKGVEVQVLSSAPEKNLPSILHRNPYSIDFYPNLGYNYPQIKV
jgi:hypothetical protein